MRISDWSSDVCSSDLGAQRQRLTDIQQCSSAPGRTPTITIRKIIGGGNRSSRIALCKEAASNRPAINSGTPGQHQIPQGPVKIEEHTSELQSLMRISYAVFCLKKQQSYNHKTH